MPNPITNATPRYRLLGINDESGRTPPVPESPLPTHLPHVFGFAERGPLTPQLVVGDSRVSTYGAKSFDYRSAYANHQTVLSNVINAEGNAQIFQRVVPRDANPRASLVLEADVLEAPVPEYDRDGDGNIILDENSNPTFTGNNVDGVIIKWILRQLPQRNSSGQIIDDTMSGEEAVPVENVMGSLSQRAGNMTYDDGGSTTESTIYPVMEFEVSHIGKYGNNVGLRLSAPTLDSAQPVKDGVITDQNAYLHRVQFVERDNKNATPNIIESVFGEQFVDFAFKEGVIDETVDQELTAEKVVIEQYQDLDNPAFPPVYGPFGRMHVYRDSYEALLGIAYELEKSHSNELPSTETEDMERYLLNLFTGVDWNADRYATIRVVGPNTVPSDTDNTTIVPQTVTLGSDPAILLNSTATHYARGGSDGTLSLVEHDNAVANECENYGDLEYNFLDTAMWPQSVIYDSGFTMDTKKKLLTPMGRRKDMMTILSTQSVVPDYDDISNPPNESGWAPRQNSVSEESSAAVALRTAARMYPESSFYGTSVCRAMVIGHSGYLISSPYSKLLPLTIEFAAKAARYMGAGDGIWEPTEAFDMPPNNQVGMFRDVNATYKPARVRNKDWDNGLVWVQNFDRRSLFFPGFQTVYDDDTSVLNAAATVFVATELEKVCQRVWRRLTGISTLTQGQFIERSDRLIEEMTANRFGDRVVIEPRTFFTGADETRGYSWSCNITLYANNMRTVGTFTITSRRRSELEGQQ